MDHSSRPLVELCSFGPIELVLTFGEPQAEYASIHKAAALFDSAQRGLLVVTGKDRHAFLGNLLTNKTWDAQTKAPLAPGTGRYSFLLNLKGRIVADMNLIERGDRTLIETDARLVDMLRTLFEKYLFSEQVKIVDATKTHAILTLIGPGAVAVLRDAGVDATALGDLGSLDDTLLNAPVTVWREDRLVPTPAFHLAVASDHVERTWNDLLDRFGDTDDGRDYGKRRLRPIGWAAFNAARIEASRPILGIDYEPAEPSMPGKKKPTPTDDVEEATPANRGAMPIETGLFDRGVDVTKGCYLGQEIVARLHARKQVPRKIASFRMNDGALPIAGAPVYDASGTTQLGIVTSSTMSPIQSDAAIGMVMLKKPHFEVGTKLMIAAEGAVRGAVVTDAQDHVTATEMPS
jgi:folate-binding protein YgfZ